MNNLHTILLRGTDLNTGETVPYIPTKWQADYHASPAKFRAFVAGVGCGKTQACAIESILACLLYPGSVNAVCRWDATGLRKTTWRTLEDIIKASGLGPLVERSVNSQIESHIKFSNGSELIGLNMKRWESLGGLALSSAFLDECHELEEPDAWDQLCVRIDRHPIGPHRAWMAGVPDSRNWVWSQFIEKQLPGHAHFGGSTFDNPFLIDGQAEQLMQRYGEKALIMILGSWDYCEGRLLENFGAANILPHQPLSAAWPRYAAVDPGWSPDPAAMVRIAVDPHGNRIVEAEYTGLKRQTEEWARDMLQVNASHPPQWYVMDRSAFSHDHRTVNTVAEMARKEGLNAREATHSVDQAVAQLRSLIQPQEGGVHPITGERGPFPRLWVLDSCPRTIWELRNLRMKKQGAASTLKGIKLPNHDHDLVDCLFYLSAEYLTPAAQDAKPGMSEFWAQLLDPEPDAPRPFLETVSRIPVPRPDRPQAVNTTPHRLPRG